jgi:hypothetical protein
MAKKYFLVLDSETTQDGKIADLGLVVCDRHGNIAYDVGLLVGDFYLNREKHPLFFTADADPLWGKRGLGKRYGKYDQMIADGRRMVASVAAINRLLVKIRLKYNPTLTAYNLAFDAGKAANSGIDLTIFENSFCLWHAAADKYIKRKDFRQFILDNAFFGARTKAGNLAFQTKADVVAKFILGAAYPDEPHTALEDARDYEVPILVEVIKNKSPKQYMNAPAYNWRNVQVKDWFKPR